MPNVIIAEPPKPRILILARPFRSPPESYLPPNELGQARSTFSELFSLDDPKSSIDDKVHKIFMNSLDVNCKIIIAPSQLLQCCHMNQVLEG